jgi:hypothetical protein
VFERAWVKGDVMDETLVERAWVYSLFLYFFCIFQSLIDTKRSIANIFDNNLQIRPDIQSFQSLPVFAESAKHG